MTEPIDFEVLRFSSQHDSTLGLLFRIENGKREWLSYTLEDQYQTVKVSGETRIPAGRYQLTLRTLGGHHGRYRRKFDFHRGMIEVTGVHGFTNILLHIGNSDDDTAGCLLVGNTSEANISAPGRIGSSTSAYRRVYPIITSLIQNQRQVWIRYVDFDTVEGE